MKWPHFVVTARNLRIGWNDRLSAAISSLARLRFLLRPSGQRIHALAFGGAPHAAEIPPHPRSFFAPDDSKLVVAMGEEHRLRAQRAMLRAPGSYADGPGQPFRPVQRRSRRPFELARRMRRKFARSHPSRASIPAQRSGLAAQPPVVQSGAQLARRKLASLQSGVAAQPPPVRACAPHAAQARQPSVRCGGTAATRSSERAACGASLPAFSPVWRHSRHPFERARRMRRKLARSHPSRSSAFPHEICGLIRRNI